MIPSVQVESPNISLAVTGEVSGASAFWDVGFWDVGFWDVGFSLRAPVIQLYKQLFSINVNP